MQTLPFSCIAEANENADLLKKAFRFCSVLIPSSNGAAPIEVGHQRTQEHVARVFGFAKWSDLTTAITADSIVSYINQNTDQNAIRQALATKLARSLDVMEIVDKVDRALSISAFGCTHNIRAYAEIWLNDSFCKTITVEQWDEIQRLQAGYRYVTRYNNSRSIFENEMIEYWHKKAVAETLGTTPPRKPRKTNPAR